MKIPRSLDPDAQAIGSASLNGKIDLIISPPKRRTFLRGVYAIDFTAKPVSSGVNREYGPNSRSL